MKYRQIFTGAEAEAAEGALNWPWQPADVEPARITATRERARQHVTDEIARLTEPAPIPPKAGRKPKADPDA